LFTSQTRSAPESSPATAYLPSGEKAADCKDVFAVVNRRSCLPVLTSHRRRVLSPSGQPPHDSRYLPSGEKVATRTGPVWPSKKRRAPGRPCQTLIMPAPPSENSCWPPGPSVTTFTPSLWAYQLRRSTPVVPSATAIVPSWLPVTSNRPLGE